MIAMFLTFNTGELILCYSTSISSVGSVPGFQNEFIEYANDKSWPCAFQCQLPQIFMIGRGEARGAARRLDKDRTRFPGWRCI